MCRVNASLEQIIAIAHKTLREESEFYVPERRLTRPKKYRIPHSLTLNGSMRLGARSNVC